MTIGQRISNSWERDGLAGMLQRSALYFLRRAGWRADSWSRNLDRHLAAQAIVRRYGPALKRNERFRDCHKGQRCFVIGNGPSLKEQDLSPLANEITFVTNYFHLHPIISAAWQPAYYCLSDPAYFDGREPIESIRDIAAKIPSALFFVPHHACDFLKTSKALPDDRTYYVGMCDGPENEFSEIPDLTTVIPPAQTVVQLAIMVAMFMGCTRIYLMGLDHDWLTQCGVTNNFYSKDSVRNQPAASDWNYKSLMEAVTTIWRIYEMHQRIAAKNGIQIINVTHGGFLDVFERARYEDVIAEPESERPA